MYYGLRNIFKNLFIFEKKGKFLPKKLALQLCVLMMFMKGKNRKGQIKVLKYIISKVENYIEIGFNFCLIQLFLYSG